MIKILAYSFLLMLGCSNMVCAQQIDDAVVRQNIGVDIPILRRTEVNAKYRLTLDDRASKFKNSLVALGITRDITKDWKIGVEYRYYMSYEQDNHRFSAFTKYTYHLHRFDIGYRLQYQQRQDYFDGDYLSIYTPQRVFRNKLMVKYDLTKRCELYTYGELFTRFKHNEWNHYRVRYALGVNCRVKKRHCVNLELFYGDEFRISNPQDVLVGEIGYTYQLKALKKKRKPGKKQ